MSSAYCAPRACALALVLAVVGCQPPVREDRTITFDANGRAAVQHGNNGVFVTDAKTGAPTRVYDPQPGDIATSPPAWEPGGTRMVFAVARSLDGTKRELTGDAPAVGRSYAEFPVRYTCYLHDPASGGEPRKLFDATAGHAAYVATGLGVCWHPRGGRLDFVERDGSRHRLRTYDLAARETTDVPLPAAENIAIGTGGPGRCVVLGGATGASGLWVEGANGAWWDVLGSAPKTANLEDLRRALPRWARDGTKLAFVSGDAVRVCDTATRKPATWFRSARTQPYAAPMVMHWHPDGTKIGVLDGTRLGLVSAAGWQKELTNAPVLAFAGWNAAGTRVAYVTRDPLPYAAGAKWAALFVPNAHARTAVRAADADGANEQVLVSGLRATFPHWAPNEARLSVWLTVEPPHRLATVGLAGMRPGDPAALIDPDAATLDWLPVNGTEHAQIGHVELRAGRTDAALKRFDRAAAGLKADAKADWMAFRAIALQKAGRAADAKAAWDRFDPASAHWAAPGQIPPNLLGPAADADRAARADFDAITARHRFIAEAFVSLELIGDGTAYFREHLTAGTDADRLSAALALSQLLLLADRKADYAECVAAHVLPLAIRAAPNATAQETVAWAVLPLAADKFVAALPEAVVRNVSEKATAAPALADLDFACHLIRRACGRRLNDAKLVEAAQAKLTTHPAVARWNLPEGEVDADVLGRVRATFLALEQVLDNLTADVR